MTQHIAIPSSPAARAEPWRWLRGAWHRFGLHLVGFASLLVLWHVISVYVFRSILFPPPFPVFRRGIELIENGKLFVEVDASLLRILAGFTLGSLLGVARAREAGWLLDDSCVALRWRWLLNRYTVIARRSGAQVVALSSSQRKVKAGVAGFSMRFSSGRSATIRYMVYSDALLLLHVVGRDGSRAPRRLLGEDAGTSRVGRGGP